MSSLREQHYAVIDASNNIINKIVYAVGDIPPNPHPCYPDHTIIAIAHHVGMQSDGWTYVNGEFIAPPPPPVPEPLPSATPTLSELQAQMAQIQMHMSTLLAQS